MRVSARDPEGKVTRLAEWTFLSTPPAERIRGEERARVAAGIYETPPAVLIADHLRPRTDANVDFLGLLQDIRNTSHRYLHYRVPLDAPLGRHHFPIDIFVDGERFRSWSADTDFFRVEELRLISVRGAGARRTALVENASPEPVPAKLCEVRELRSGKLSCSAKMVVLPPRARTAVPCPREGTFLLYAEDQGRIALRDPDAPLVLRDPRCRWVADEAREEIYVRREDEERVHVLSGRPRAVWQAANGLRSRAELRRGGDVRAYDLLLRRRLLCEIPVQNPHGLG
jgi:hypothetical protein